MLLCSTSTRGATLLAWVGLSVNQVVFNLYLVSGGYREDFVGAVSSMQGVGMAMVALPAGWAADRFGRRALLRTGSLTIACALLLRSLSLLPTALLGASKPLKAFIGHVEPTFDWTLRDTRNKQVLTSGIVSALYSELFLANPVPVGLAFKSVFSTVAGQQNIANLKRAEAVDLAKREAATKEMVRAQLLAHDRQNIVILGDPTVALPTAV